MGNYLHLCALILFLILGPNRTANVKELDCLAPKSYFTKSILRSSNAVYDELDKYHDRVEVSEQEQMLDKMEDWLYEVNAYIISGAVPHNTIKHVLAPERLNALKKEHPHMSWEKASILSFAEIIRNPFSQNSTTDMFQFEGESVQTIANQKNYFVNQASVRKDMIFMMKDIAEGKLEDPEDLRTKLGQMHKKLLLGENDDTPYYPITLLRGNRGVQDLSELRSIAGTDSDFYRNYDFMNLLLVVQEFLAKDEITSKDIKDLSDIYSRFIRLESDYAFANMRYMFKFGNNSLFMNMINTMLTLKGVDPVSHYHFDFNSIVLPSYYKQLFPGFLAADLSFSEIMNAFFQMALYRNMDKQFFKELFQAFAYRLKWLHHPVDFLYRDTASVFDLAA